MDNRGLVINMMAFRKSTGASYETMLNKLTLKYQEKMGGEKILRCYRISAGNIILPRYFLRILSSSKLINKVKIDMPLIPHNMVTLMINLYNYQLVVVKHLLETVYTTPRANIGLACATLDLKAGAGKTFVAAGLIAALSVKTLYIVFLKDLASQAKADLTLALSDPSIVDVKVINSALKMPDTELKKYSFVIIDEVHKMCSRHRSEIFFRAHARYSLAMSATTSHLKNGFDKAYYLQYGPVIHAAGIPDFNFDGAEFKLYVDVIKYIGPPEYTKTLTHESTGRPFVHYMYNQFISDELRMGIIVQNIRQLYSENHNIFVFAEEREHLQRIMERIQAEFDDIAEVDDADNIIGYYVGGLKSAQVANIKSRARIVLTTYSLSSTGTSWTHMTAMIMATPRRSSIEQLAARIMRMGSDINFPRKIIDINDTATCLRGQLNDRLTAYARYNAKVRFKKINHNSLRIQQ